MRQTSTAEYAALAHDVYKGSPKGSKVYSWTRQNFLGDPTNGFFAAAYRTPRTRKLVVAYRGTDDSLLKFEKDWQNNLGWNFFGKAEGHWNSQLNTAMSYFKAVRSIYNAESCAVCGHSLGGFLASMVAIKGGILGVTFNPAPLGASADKSMSARIVNFRLKGDVVSGLRRYNIGPMIELELSRAELWVRKSGWLGDVDPVMHSMALVEEAILRHKNSNLSPEEWAAKV